MHFCCKDRPKLPKEQDIPAKAFTTLQEHKHQIGEFSDPVNSSTSVWQQTGEFDERKDFQCPLVVSHPWWAIEHPDPEGQQLGWVILMKNK